jgi:hypothetical protein
LPIDRGAKKLTSGAIERTKSHRSDAVVLVYGLWFLPTSHDVVGLISARGRKRDSIHEATGAFVNADPVHLQSTGFVLDPGGNVVISVYSSGPIGRLVPEDVAGLVNYVKSKQPA